MSPRKNKRCRERREKVVCRTCGHRLRRRRHLGSYGACPLCGGALQRPHLCSGKRKSGYSDNRWSGQVHPCPACGSETTEAYCRRRPIRYHRCLATLTDAKGKQKPCGHHWKSTEQVIRGEPL